MSELGSEPELEAAVFRRLVQHLDKRKDVQNIELMSLAGFCRNCLSKWYVEAAAEAGVSLDLEEPLEADDYYNAIIWGLPLRLR